MPADARIAAVPEVTVAGRVRPSGRAASAATLPRVPVETLMAGGREAVLLHAGTEYRLRLTSNGKLILTK